MRDSFKNHKACWDHAVAVAEGIRLVGSGARSFLGMCRNCSLRY